MVGGVLKPAPPPPIDRDAAALCLLQSEVLRHSAGYRHLRAWEAAQAAGLVGSAGGWAGPEARSTLECGSFFRPPLTSPDLLKPAGSLKLAC